MSEDNKIVSLAGAKKDKSKEKEDNNTQEVVYCSFCSRPNYQVVKMVQGPGVNICSECTMIATQYLILEDRLPSSEAQGILDAFWQGSKK